MDFNTMTALIKQNVHEIDDTAEVWLYGSRVRGDAHEESDWDVLVLSSKDKLTFKEEEQFMDNICNLMVKTGRLYNCSLTVTRIGIPAIPLHLFIKVCNQKPYNYEQYGEYE